MDILDILIKASKIGIKNALKESRKELEREKEEYKKALKVLFDNVTFYYPYELGTPDKPMEKYEAVDLWDVGNPLRTYYLHKEKDVWIIKLFERITSKIRYIENELKRLK